MQGKARLIACLSSEKPADEYQPVLHSFLPCNTIYSKEYHDGVIYVLNLSTQTRRTKISNHMNEINTELKRIEGNESSRFAQIGDDGGMMFRVLHQDDEYYNAVFSSAINADTKVVHAGVEVWTPTGGFEEDTGDETATDIMAVPLCVFEDSDEVKDLKRKLLDATACGARYKKKFEDKHGEPHDVKMYTERIKNLAEERDEAKHEASQFEWKLIESERHKEYAVRFLRSEQEKTASLQLTIDDLQRALARKK